MTTKGRHLRKPGTTRETLCGARGSDNDLRTGQATINWTCPDCLAIFTGARRAT